MPNYFQHWPELVKDIETGDSNHDSDTPEDARKQFKLSLNQISKSRCIKWRIRSRPDDIDIGSSESPPSANLSRSQKHPNYCLVPSTQLFEFTSVSKSSENQPDTLFLHQAVQGEKHELAITNLSGPHRHRLWDAIKAVEFIMKLIHLVQA